MKQMINTVVTDMLTALYQPFMFAVVLAVFFMFLYMYANCPKEAGRGCKAAIVSWLRQFKNSRFFRRLFVLVLYTSLVLFRKKSPPTSQATFPLKTCSGRMTTASPSSLSPTGK